MRPFVSSEIPRVSVSFPWGFEHVAPIVLEVRQLFLPCFHFGFGALRFVSSFPAIGGLFGNGLFGAMQAHGQT